MTRMNPNASQNSRVLVQLRDMILKGEFVPGERLAEIPLSERLNTSRTPVRLALGTLEQEGLIELSTSGGYQMRGYTAKEVLDAIRARGVLEGFAARTLAEQGLSRALFKELKLCLDIGDEAVNKHEMDLDDYASYVNMNKDFHGLIMDGCENASVLRMMERLNSMPFASPSAMLPMQSTLEEGTRWMQLAHLQHHHLFQALERGQSARAQALGEEHVEIACRNLEYALEKPELAIQLLPAMRLVTGTNRRTVLKA